MKQPPVQSGTLLDARPARADREVFEVLLERPGVRIERILSRGQSTPPGEWYDQPEDEWVALLAGRATLRFDGGTKLAMAPGDWVLIPAHARHRVEATSRRPPCVWIAAHILPAQPRRRPARGGGAGGRAR